MARFRLARAQSIPAPGLDSRPAPVSAAPAKPAAVRRVPLGRTVSRARWREYRGLLTEAREQGYQIWSLEEWLSAPAPAAPADGTRVLPAPAAPADGTRVLPAPAAPADGTRVAILRHDVDQHPRSALPMLAIESELGVRSTWYFRWRTASRPVIDAVRAAGGQVGLHYETLTRLMLERQLDGRDLDRELLTEARAVLRREIAAFQRSFGPITSVCPHGDSRVPGASNQVLLEGQRPSDYGIEFDGNEAVSRRSVSLWLTDRSIPDGRWKDGIDPHAELAAGTSPLLLVVHPNNWCSGTSLWRDRALAAALPTPAPAGHPARRRSSPRVVRTGSDRPPPLPATVAPGPPSGGGHAMDFAPVCASLRREVLRFYYDGGRTLTEPAGLGTLATNAELAEARAATLEQALADAGVAGMKGLDVLDVGCGFGALSLVFAAHGARVLALDPNLERMQVGETVAGLHGLPVRFAAASMEEMHVREASFDVAVMNNSLCYVVRRRERREALRRTLAALRPGGVLLIRNPNRIHPRDQFTGVPLLGLLAPAAARSTAKLMRKHRSDVRLVSGPAARRELRRAGFADVRSFRRPRDSRLRSAVTGYQHLTARRAEG